MGRGRTDKIKFETIKEAMAGFGRLKLNRTEIGCVYGVSYRTINRYVKKYPQLLTLYFEGYSELIRGLKTKAIKLARDGDTDMIKYVLKNVSNWKDRGDPTLEIKADENNVIVYLPKQEDYESPEYDLEIKKKEIA